MITKDPVSLAVHESSQVGEARRVGVSMAQAMGFDTIACAEFAIVLTETATNLVRHATAGEMILRSLPPADCCGLEILALDRGPGIRDVANALRDGFTTGRSPGNGMGAIHRLSTAMEIYSGVNHGTAMVVQVHLDGHKVPALTDVAWVSLPKRGETACGDACDVIDLGGGRTVVIIADGLGHGLHAAEASRKAVNLFRENPSLDGPEQMERLHAALRSTRGAAISIADVRRGQNELRFTGVGNVAGQIIVADRARGLLCHNGTVGAELRRAKEAIYPWSAESLLVMHTDGLTSQWQLSTYPGLSGRHASLIAGVLYHDFRRERDDVTVLALSGRRSA